MCEYFWYKGNTNIQKWEKIMGDKSVKNRDWSGARELSEEAKEALKDMREEKKIKELANKQAVRPINKKVKSK